MCNYVAYTRFYKVRFLHLYTYDAEHRWYISQLYVDKKNAKILHASSSFIQF